jgi:hypothetical protein
MHVQCWYVLNFYKQNYIFELFIKNIVLEKYCIGKILFSLGLFFTFNCGMHVCTASMPMHPVRWCANWIYNWKIWRAWTPSGGKWLTRRHKTYPLKEQHKIAILL